MKPAPVLSNLPLQNPHLTQGFYPPSSFSLMANDFPLHCGRGNISTTTESPWIARFLIPIPGINISESTCDPSLADCALQKLNSKIYYTFNPTCTNVLYIQPNKYYTFDINTVNIKTDQSVMLAFEYRQQRHWTQIMNPEFFLPTLEWKCRQIQY